MTFLMGCLVGWLVGSIGTGFVLAFFIGAREPETLLDRHYSDLEGVK